MYPRTHIYVLFYTVQGNFLAFLLANNVFLLDISLSWLKINKIISGRVPNEIIIQGALFH